MWNERGGGEKRVTIGENFEQAGINRSLFARYLSSVEQIFSILIHFIRHTVYIFPIVSHRINLYMAQHEQKTNSSLYFSSSSLKDGVEFRDREFSKICNFFDVAISRRRSGLKRKENRKWRIPWNSVPRKIQPSQLYRMRERFRKLFRPFQQVKRLILLSSPFFYPIIHSFILKIDQKLQNNPLLASNLTLFGRFLN